MSSKRIRGNVAWKKFTSNSLFSYLGLPGEPILNMMVSPPEVRVCDGIKAGGHIVGYSSNGLGIVTPLIIAPLDGSYNVTSTPTITLSGFNGRRQDGLEDTHASTYWQIAEDNLFKNLVYSIDADAVNLTSLDLSTIPLVLENKTYYVRAFYEGASGLTSGWTASHHFTVGEISIGTTLPEGTVAGQLDGFWLVVGSAETRQELKWGLKGVDTSLPNAPYPDPNTGEFNTDTLTSVAYGITTDVDGTVGSPAAAHCRAVEGAEYSLPNKQELEVIYASRASIDLAEETSDVKLVDLSNVWTSTEFDTNNAEAMDFTTGTWVPKDKGTVAWVLPLTKIPV